ncbi:hypothetical protein NMY22_g15901 [Coprinellus aureogranulatus]|nr:hypothetical protein NMY22_g15901 [Coprinellus aureogranulatus]
MAVLLGGGQGLSPISVSVSSWSPSRVVLASSCKVPREIEPKSEDLVPEIEPKSEDTLVPKIELQPQQRWNMDADGDHSKQEIGIVKEEPEEATIPAEVEDESCGIHDIKSHFNTEDNRLEDNVEKSVFSDTQDALTTNKLHDQELKVVVKVEPKEEKVPDPRSDLQEGRVASVRRVTESRATMWVHPSSVSRHAWKLIGQRVNANDEKMDVDEGQAPFPHTHVGMFANPPRSQEKNVVDKTESEKQEVPDSRPGSVL